MGPMRLAIDYGSSHTVAVLGWPDGRTRPVLGEGSALFSSAVYADPSGELLVGREAVLASGSDPSRFEPFPKRRVDEVEVLLGDRPVPVVDMLAATLTSVTDEATRVAGARPDEVALTHPATWGPTRRAMLRTAAERAGLAVPSMLAEPVAAGRYFVEVASGQIADGAPLLVYDLGGGTFDVTLLRRTGDGFETVVVDGIPDFGGADLDAIVVDIVGEAAAERVPQVWARLSAPATVEDRRGFRALWESARFAKESLSRRPSASIAVPGTDVQVHVTREQFEERATPLLTLTVDAAAAALRRAGAQPAELAGIFLVGGATRVPLVATLLHQALHRPPTVLDQPETVVAEGAVRTLPPGAAAAGSSPPLVAAAPRVPPQPSVAAYEETPEQLAPQAAVGTDQAASARPTGAGPTYSARATRGERVLLFLFFSAITAFIFVNGTAMTEHGTELTYLGVWAAQMGSMVIAIWELVNIVMPSRLTVDPRGIYYQGRTGNGLRRYMLTWEQVAAAEVAKLGGHDHLVVYSPVSMPDLPRNGPVLHNVREAFNPAAGSPPPLSPGAGQRYILCKIEHVNANPAKLREVLAQYVPSRVPGAA